MWCVGVSFCFAPCDCWRSDTTGNAWAGEEWKLNVLTKMWWVLRAEKEVMPTSNKDPNVPKSVQTSTTEELRERDNLNA